MEEVFITADGFSVTVDELEQERAALLRSIEEKAKVCYDLRLLGIVSSLLESSNRV